MILEKQANQIFEELITEAAEIRGFKLIKNRGSKTDPPYLERRKGLDIEIIGNLHLEYFNGKLLMTEAFSKHIERIETFWFNHYQNIHTVTPRFSKDSLITIGSNASLFIDYEYGKSPIPWFRYRDNYEAEATEQGVWSIADSLIEKIDKYIIPLLNKYDTIETIDRDMNATPETYFECIHIFTGNGLMFKKMIVAKMAGNPQYNIICDLMRKRILSLEDEPESAKRKYLAVWDDIKRELN